MNEAQEMVAAATLARERLEIALADLLPAVAKLLRSAQRTAVVVGTEMLVTGLQLLAHAEPDEDEYVKLARGFAVLDEDSLRRLHKGTQLE
jgi:hypothetical protein